MEISSFSDVVTAQIVLLSETWRFYDAKKVTL